MKPIVCIVGTRPNYMKMAPIPAAFEEHDPPIPYRLVHTSQHYAATMERVFFEMFGLPTPHANLAVGTGTNAVQTARIIERLDPCWTRSIRPRPSWSATSTPQSRR